MEGDHAVLVYARHMIMAGKPVAFDPYVKSAADFDDDDDVLTIEGSAEELRESASWFEGQKDRFSRTVAKSINEFISRKELRC